MAQIIAKTGCKACEREFEIAHTEHIKNVCRAIQDASITTQGKNLYFAGPFFTPKQKIVQDTCYNIWLNCSPCSRFKSVFFPMLQENLSPEETFENNKFNVENCDELIAFVSDKDIGTAFEIGYALALKKKVTLLVYDRSDILSHTNVMLAFAGDVIELIEFEQFLKSENYATVIIPDDWEGKE